ncbi:hypothetical protein HPULCUR_002484 [Helicostylum pulchrum]|uniref:Transposase n=1 Tax=Helicostylum pulchrum TaxID=562976 RepID=A0ABP9XS37_9FUNG
MKPFVAELDEPFLAVVQVGFAALITTSAHCTKFINELLDILDDMGDMKGSYAIMDNCSIHVSKLNAIEQFWSLVKGKMKRDKLLQSGTISSRIKGACEQALLSDLYGFANHSKRQISKCYDRIPF